MPFALGLHTFSIDIAIEFARASWLQKPSQVQMRGQLPIQSTRREQEGSQLIMGG